MPQPLQVRSSSKVTVGPTPYVLRISRLTVDKLGVKLYDRVSAVVAELVANSYDADAETVVVKLPLNVMLATRQDGIAHDLNYVVEVVDNGHGMTPEEAKGFYLLVGRDRRRYTETSRSRSKNRPVMGRKGIGKLAPFGICKRIEVESAGGPSTSKGYRVSHFVMDYDRILAEDDSPIDLERGTRDESFAPACGTTIRLSSFLPKRVPSEETFHRQLAARFALVKPDFEILVQNTAEEGAMPRLVSPLSVPIVDSTMIDLSQRPVRTDAGEVLPVTGWIAMAQDSYKHEEAAGVRIYARDKIVATTRDFDRPAGFTGEFTARSYLVGEVHAEWLDLDVGEDLIRSDRQGIIWDSDYGRALRQWGAELIKEVAVRSRGPRQKKTREKFLEKTNLGEKAKTIYAQPEIAEAAVQLAEQIGGFADEDELEDQAYINDLSDFILSVAPQRALIEAFKEFQKKIDSGEHSFDDLLELFGKTRVAEMASYSRIAVDRVRSIRSLSELVNSPVDEPEEKYQQLIQDAPWLIEPTWSVITQNQQLDTFKRAFAKFWKRRHNEDISFDVMYGIKRPDFILINVGQKLHIVEIKAGGHSFGNEDCERMINYVEAFTNFFSENKFIAADFPNG